MECMMKTPLQNFAELCTAKIIDCEYEVLAAATEAYERGDPQGPVVGIEIEVIIILIETITAMIIEIMNNCPANDDQVRKSIKRPGFMQRVRFRVLVMETCRQGEPRWRGEANRIASIMMAQAKAYPDDEIDAVVDQCRNLGLGVC